MGKLSATLSSSVTGLVNFAINLFAPVLQMHPSLGKAHFKDSGTGRPEKFRLRNSLISVSVDIPEVVLHFLGSDLAISVLVQTEEDVRKGAEHWVYPLQHLRLLAVFTHFTSRNFGSSA